jgi:hypothetical protein
MTRFASLERAEESAICRLEQAGVANGVAARRRPRGRGLCTCERLNQRAVEIAHLSMFHEQDARAVCLLKASPCGVVVLSKSV